ncbi:MAG: ImmA/IrrE family metallo-endopeptidase [Kiritimatiellae bacterium]|nr:ImmA/IrrE family metallo-endopeptidase [Kiritimatiellia bacterium]MDD5519464.1 ImmA/IrrE family metallo-endopeptidase [Kiritimatiellia bacterium]
MSDGIKPFVVLGPGDAIKEEMEYYGWEQKDLAEIMGRSETSLSLLLNNKVRITEETASLLSKIFKQSPTFWLNLDINYRNRLKENPKLLEAAHRALIYTYMPIRELRASYQFPKSKQQLTDSVLKFWGIPELDFGFIEEKNAACFRKSSAYRQFNKYFAYTWLQIIRNRAKHVATNNKYSHTRLESLSQAIPEFTTQKEGVSSFIQELNKCGVTFLVAKHLSKTYIDGASVIHEKKPCLAYSARKDTVDNFWFTISHEIGHILKHLRTASDCFIDCLDNTEEERVKDKKEKEANLFAQNILKTKEILGYFKDTVRFNEKRIRECADSLLLTPAIVCGCLQYHNKIGYARYHDLKPKVSVQIPSQYRVLDCY